MQERARRHLIALREWSQEQHTAYEAEAAEEVRTVQAQAESVGTLDAGNRADPALLFENIFEEPDWRHKSQRRELGG